MSIIEQTLNYLSKKLEINSGNIAAVNKPGFKAKELEDIKSFASHMGSSNVNLFATNPMHLEGKKKTNFRVKNKTEGVELKPNGNNVLLTNEVQEAAKIQLDYSTATQIYNSNNNIYLAALGRGG